MSDKLALTDDLSYLYSPNSKYSAEEKLSVVTVYALTGNLETCHKQTGINYETIKDWHTRSSWWPEAMQNVRKAMQDQLDGKLTGIINRATDEIIDRIDNGEEVIDKNGNTRRRKLSARDMTMVMAILFDKRALIRGDPTTRTEKVSSEETLNKMLSKFEDLAKKMNTNVINATPSYKIDNDVENN